MAENPTEDYAVRIASLSESGQEQVLEAVRAAEASGSAATFEVHQAIVNAESADEYAEQARHYQQEQAKAAHDGNWTLAEDYAQKAQDAYDTAVDHGLTTAEAPLVQAEQDVTDFGSARWHQSIANENAAAAADLVAAGDPDAASMYASAAADHQSAADQYGHGGSHDADADAGRASSDAASGTHEDAATESYASADTTDTSSDA